MITKRFENYPMVKIIDNYVFDILFYKELQAITRR